MGTIAVSDATFEAEVLRSELPVLVDLYAEWCAPCKQMAPLLEGIADEYEGKLRVAKVDIEKSPMVAQTFRVQSIPMLVVFAQGQVAGHHVGALDKNGIIKLIEPVLPADASEVKPEELDQLIKAKRVVPVDLRDAASFARYRIPTAVNVPAEEAASRASEFASGDGCVRVVYGRTTDEAKETADALGAHGVQVGFLVGGFLHWEADGFEVERGS